MPNLKFKGTGVALVTPFRNNGEVDYPSLKRLVNHCIDGGVEYLVVMGTTGESATMSAYEKLKVADFVAEANGGRLPLVFGMGGNHTQELVTNLQMLKLEGYSAILSVSPYYNKPTQKGIEAHYAAIASVSSLPIILYNVPARTGSNLLPETTIKLAESHPNIIAIKEASGNLEQAMELIKNKPTDFLVISGDDNLTLPLISLGAQGVISVSANAYPQIVAKLVRNALGGYFEKASLCHYAIFNFTQLLFKEGNPSGIKAALKHLKISDDFVRLPLVPVSAALNEILAAEVRKLNQYIFDISRGQ